MTTINILIGIQARSNSTRFPGKIYERIGNLRVLDHVIDRAKSTADYINRYGKVKLNCQVAVLHPSHDDRIVKEFAHCGVPLIGGSEEDVLSRYVKARNLTNADYIVRLTSDCPLILDFVIAKHINTAVFNSLDYVSNVEENCRFIADGFDCEVISKKALDWLDANATNYLDREHVTTAIRREHPEGLSQGFVSMKIDTTNMKMSVDTPEDLNRMREYYERRLHKMNVAKQKFGRHVYEL